MIYTKDFLIDAFLWRYAEVLLNYTVEQLNAFVKMTTDFYDKVGKDTFRVYASLDADSLKKFRLATGY
jgi:hypothetical protein